MLTEMLTLAQSDGGGGEFIYVIAVLILSVVGALADRFKKRQEARAEEEQAAPARPSRPTAGTAPQRPTAPPTAPPARRPAPPVVVTEPAERTRPTRTARPVGDRSRPAPQAAKRRPAKPEPPTPTTLGPQPVVVRRAQPTALSEDSVVSSTRIDVSRSISTSISQPQAQAATATSTQTLRHLSRQELRRAIILSEILAPPLALRDPTAGSPVGG